MLRSQMDGLPPVNVELLLPEGVNLISGQLREQVNVSTQQPTATRQFVVAVAKPLREPIRVRAQFRVGDVMGAFAERLYPEPPAPAVPTAGQATTIGNLPLGPPVETTKAP